MPHNSDALFTPYLAFFSDHQEVSIFDAVSQMAASTIRIYPPGTPIICPGMIYTKEIVSTLLSAHNAGAQIVGVDFTKQAKVKIVKRKSNYMTGKEMRRSSSFTIRTYLSNELSESIIDEVAEFYSVGFSGQPYFHFAIDEKNPSAPLPPGLDFHGWERSNQLHDETQKRSVQSIFMKEAKLSSQPWYSEAELSKIDLPPGYYRWSDPDKVRQIMRGRFQDPGYVTLVRDKQTQELRGLLHARMANFQQLFETEEWRNPFLFSRYNNASLHDDPKRFFKELKDSLGYCADDNTMIISAQLLHPSAYGGDVFFDMMYDMASRVTAYHRSLPLVAEIPKEGTAHVFNVAASEKLFTNILANGHPFIYTHKTDDALNNFLKGKSHWNKVLRAEIKRLRRAA